MRAYEFLIEDRSEAVNQMMGHKIWQAYEKKKGNDPTLTFIDSLGVLKHINSFIPDQFMKWVSKQYIRDPYFFLHDLKQCQQLLNQFVELSKDKRFEFNKNIDAYTDVNQLQSTLSNLGNKREEIGSKFYDKVINGLNTFVENNQARWIYQDSNYSIYEPLTWESSNIISKLCDNVTACVIKNNGNYDAYKKDGYLYYTISQDNVYIAYLPIKSENDEFSDKSNNHLFDLSYQTQHFPKLFEIIKELYKSKKITGTDKFKFIIDPSINPAEYAFKHMSQISNYKIPDSLDDAFDGIETVEFFRKHIDKEQFAELEKTTKYRNLIYRIIDYLIPEEEEYDNNWDSVAEFEVIQKKKQRPIDLICDYWFSIEKCNNKEIIDTCRDFIESTEYFGDCTFDQLNTLVYEMTLCSQQAKQYINSRFLIPKEQNLLNKLVKQVEIFNLGRQSLDAARTICNLINGSHIRWVDSKYKKAFNNIGNFETIDDLYSYMEDYVVENSK